MDFVRQLLILLSSIVVEVTMKRKQGCFTPVNISCAVTILSCAEHKAIDLQNIVFKGTCSQINTCVEPLDEDKPLDEDYPLDEDKYLYQFTLKDVISIYKQCSSQQSCTIVSQHKKNGPSGLYDYMKYTYKVTTTTSTTDSNTMVTTLSNIFTIPSTTVNITNTHTDDNSANTDAIKETGGDTSKTGAMKQTGCNSVITIVAVTVTVVILVEVVVVLIVIFIYRKRRVKNALNTDRVVNTDKTTDAYDEITNFNGYETAVDPRLSSTLSSGQAVTTTRTPVSTQSLTTDLSETAGKSCKPETPVYHILQPDEEEKPPKDHKSDLKASDTYDHIGQTNAMHQDKDQFNTPVQQPGVPLTTKTNYENIKLDDCNIKDNSTYNHLYSDNNHTKPDAGDRHIDGARVTTILDDDDTYNHLHDTQARERIDVSLDIMEDNSHTRPDAMNDNSEDNDTYNHLHEG